MSEESVASQAPPRVREAQMYQFSRAIYRELGTEILPGSPVSVCRRRQQLLRACEPTMERLAADRQVPAWLPSAPFKRAPAATTNNGGGAAQPAQTTP